MSVMLANHRQADSANRALRTDVLHAGRRDDEGSPDRGGGPRHREREVRVGGDLPVVAQTGEAGDAVVQPLERLEDLADHRVPGEQREADHRADQESVRLHVAPYFADELGLGLLVLSNGLGPA